MLYYEQNEKRTRDIVTTNMTLIVKAEMTVLYKLGCLLLGLPSPILILLP